MQKSFPCHDVMMNIIRHPIVSPPFTYPPRCQHNPLFSRLYVFGYFAVRQTSTKLRFYKRNAIHIWGVCPDKQWCIFVNSLRSRDAYMRQNDHSSLATSHYLKQCWIIVNSNLRLGTNFSDILSEISTVSFKNMHLKMSSAKWPPFSSSLNVLTAHIPLAMPYDIYKREINHALQHYMGVTQ